MNRIRRKAIAALMSRLDDIRTQLEDIQSEEEDARDAIPENLWGTERYEMAEAACDALESAVYALEECVEHLEEAAE